MRLAGNTVLITGVGTGIGGALAGAFVRARSEVIICGRREERLRAAQGPLPMVHAHTCDVARAENRLALWDWVHDRFLAINMLVNNAGVQRDVSLRSGIEDFLSGENEIRVNLAARVHNECPAAFPIGTSKDRSWPSCDQASRLVRASGQEPIAVIQPIK
jgi:uncharacterized oxidoreductase